MQGTFSLGSFLVPLVILLSLATTSVAAEESIAFQGDLNYGIGGGIETANPQIRDGGYQYMHIGTQYYFNGGNSVAQVEIGWVKSAILTPQCYALAIDTFGGSVMQPVAHKRRDHYTTMQFWRLPPLQAYGL